MHGKYNVSLSYGKYTDVSEQYYSLQHIASLVALRTTTHICTHIPGNDNHHNENGAFLREMLV